MRYLLFTIVCLIAGYLLVTSLLFLKNKKFSIDDRFISRDVSNVAKGLSTLFVLVSHVSNLYDIRYMTPLGSWGVAIFLFLSAYGLEESCKKNSLKQFWRKRFLSAYLPYIVVEIIAIIFASMPEYEGITFSAILWDFFLIEPLHPYGWYMQCLFFNYAVYYVAQKTCFGNKNIKYFIVITAQIILFLFSRSLFRQQCLSFFIGLWVADNREMVRKYADKFMYSLVSLLAGISIIALRQLTIIRNLPPLFYHGLEALQASFLMIGTAFLLYWLVKRLPGIWFAVLKKIGSIAYEVYLVQCFFIATLLTPFFAYKTIILFFVITFSTAIAFHFIQKSVKRIVLKMMQ